MLHLFCRCMFVICSSFGALRRLCFIMKTCLYNFDPLKPHFYLVKLGFTGVYIIFLISAQKHRLWVLVRTASPRRFSQVPTNYVLDCGYSSEPPHRGGSHKYPQTMFWAEIWKISVFFIWKFSVFGEISIYLNKGVFVMWWFLHSGISSIIFLLIIPHLHLSFISPSNDRSYYVVTSSVRPSVH